MKKKLTLLTLAIGTLFGANAQQDQHFSMFSESMLFANPAVAGFIEGDLQLFTNHRLQWSSISDNPYRSTSASADWRMFDQGGSRFGAGVSFYNDIAGGGDYLTNIISIPVNYAIQLDAKNFLSFGLQPSFYQRTIQSLALNWDSQWTGVEFNQALPNNEVILNQNLSLNRFDVAAGVYWDGNISETARLMLGISGQHLTKQRINFTTEDARLYRKLNFHGQAEFKNEITGVTVLPAFAAFLQGPNKEIIFGSNFSFLLKGASRTTSYFDEVKLSLGSYFRVGDALIVNAIFDISALRIGASYDLNISSLTAASKGIGGVEFFLKYHLLIGNRDLRNNRVIDK